MQWMCGEEDEQCSERSWLACKAKAIRNSRGRGCRDSTTPIANAIGTLKYLLPPKRKNRPKRSVDAPILPRSPRSIAAAASAKNMPPACFLNAAGIRTHRLLTQSALSSTYSHQNEKTDLKGRFRFGGSRWIRTTEGIASRFTVCPLWPLGNTPMYSSYSLGTLT